ncbi:MAG: hypothetical protein V4596_02840 [Bdellovibrionota bacterium]
MTKLVLILSLFFVINVMSSNGFAAEAIQSDIYAGEKNISQERDHHPNYYTFFDWARGQNGWGYCYEFDNHGYVLNNGRPVHPMNCERVNPSYFDWGRGFDGYIYCYQWTPYHVIMNDGYAVNPRYCR